MDALPSAQTCIVIASFFALALSGCVDPEPVDAPEVAAPVSVSTTAAAPDAEASASRDAVQTQSLEPISLRYEADAVEFLMHESFHVPEGADRLAFTVFLNSSEPGLYWVDASKCLCDPWLTLYSPTDIFDGDYSWRQDWGYVGGEPVAGVGPGVILGPFEGSVKSPGEGTWTLQLRGAGQNAVAMFTGNVSPTEAPKSPDAPGEPRPDLRLETVVVPISPSGFPPASRAFEVPAGASRMGFQLVLNASARGPYWLDWSGCLCDPSLQLFSPLGGQVFSYSLPPAPFVDAGFALGPQTLLGPIDGAVEPPLEGLWSLRLRASGHNLEADLNVVVSFA